VWEGDPQTFGFSFVSHRAEEILGYRVERWLAEPGFWSDHIHPDDREWALDYCTKASAKNSAHQFEYRMLAADGRVVWLRDIVTIVVEEDGSKKARGVMIDITEHKRAEEALRASEERFSKAFHASPLPMSIGRDLHFIDVNDTLLLGSGYTRDEIIGRSAIELGMLPDLDEVHKMRQLIDEQGAVRNLEMNLRMKNGELRLHLISAEPIELGGEQCLLMVGDDITERKRAEEEQARLQAGLRESAREWRLTFDTVESLIMILDLEGRVKRLNRCAKEISGRDYTESLRGSVALMAEGQPWQKIAELARSVARTRRATSAQVKDDSTGRTWDIALSLFAGPEVEEERIIVVARDITAMVELQESLRRSETLYAMGKLVAGVAHEVRNPLFGISATLDAFDLRFGDQQEYSRYTDTLRGEANRLSQLMQELLDYGKPVTLELAESSIESVMTEAIKVCAPLAEKAKVRLVEKCGGEFTPVLMDRKRMAQVFRNLIENAIQHSTEGARVEIEAKEVLEGGRKWVECAVKDSGPGFDEESIQRIFDPFFTKRKGGTGLGLSIVQRIVEEHSGRVEAGNRPEGGAQVLVRFPRARL
ncbi:MAG: PAS domain S-box protein, partial [Blastocatellia bacterium]|nr:PAS domain S-box protein [Blastocatellia bacterium]